MLKSAMSELIGSWDGFDDISYESLCSDRKEQPKTETPKTTATVSKKPEPVKSNDTNKYQINALKKQIDELKSALAKEKKKAKTPIEVTVVDPIDKVTENINPSTEIAIIDVEPSELKAAPPQQAKSSKPEAQQKKGKKKDKKKKVNLNENVPITPFTYLAGIVNTELYNQYDSILCPISIPIDGEKLCRISTLLKGELKASNKDVPELFIISSIESIDKYRIHGVIKDYNDDLVPGDLYATVNGDTLSFTDAVTPAPAA